MTIAPERIQHLELFEGLPEATLRRLAEAARQAEMGSGEALAKADIPAEEAVFIERGIAAVFLNTPEGRPMLCDLLGAGRLAVPGRALQPGTASLEVRTLMPTRAITIPGEVMQAFLLADASVAMRVYQRLLAVEHRRLAHLAGAISAEPGTFARAEECPLERQSRVVLTGEVRTGEVQGFCRLQGMCPGSGEQGCPLADRPPHEFIRLWQTGSRA